MSGQLEPGLEVSQEDADIFKVLWKSHDLWWSMWGNNL